MRQRELEILLEKFVPPFRHPRPELEQYRTPAGVAADLLYKAAARGDVVERRVLDLGCGTGMLAIGAALLGAEARGVDADEDAVALAREAAERAGVDVSFDVADVAHDLEEEADTVLMNPPFGAQSPGADRPFVDAALRAAPVVYALHNAGTEAFLEAFARARGARVTDRWPYRFAIPHQFFFHTKARQEVPVVALRYERADSASAF